MTSLRVIEHLDIVEDIGPSVIATRVDLTTDAFTFKQLKEAFGHGVVVAVAATAHAGDQVVITQKVLPVIPSELAALIRMDHSRLLGSRRHSAITSALSTRPVSMRLPMNHPTT